VCPVLRWCLGNVAIEQNPAGDIKMYKSKAREKIDGAVALAMAVGVAQTEGQGTRCGEGGGRGSAALPPCKPAT
jgi:phage terminase large subunit-like protein